MAATVGQILKEAARELEDYVDIAGDDREFDVEKDLLAYFNEGLSILWTFIRYFGPDIIQKQETITIPASSEKSDSPSYASLSVMPLSVVEVFDVTNKRPLGAKPIHELYRTGNNSGAPSAYCHLGLKDIYVDTTSDEDIELRVHYIPDVAYLNYDSSIGVDDEIPLPVVYNRFLKEYILIRAHNRNGARPELETAFLRKHEDELYRLMKARNPTALIGSGPWVV